MTNQRTDQEKNRSEKKTIASRKLASGLGWVAAWVWAIVAGGGGLLLLLSRGPLPLTNGWFALFSGLAACPLTATLSQKCVGITLSGRVRIAAAMLFFIAGRIALIVGSRVPWLSR
jgi:hypothetical protein